MDFVTKIDLKEFRGIKGFQKPLNLRKFNILLGRNNSGKTAVLQSLSILPHPDIDQPMTLGFGGSSRKDFLCNLVGGRSSIVYKYSGNAVLNFSFDTTEYSVTFDERVNARVFIGQTKYGVNDALRHLNIVEEALNWSVYVPNDSSFVDQVNLRLSQEWARVVKTKGHVKVTKNIINPTIDESFTEIIRENGNLKVRKEVGGEPSYIDIKDLGDGVEKALCIALFIEVCNPRLVIWDDFEASAHPSLLRNLLSWLSKKDWQVVLATHSIDTLHEIAEIEPEDSQVIQLKKTADDILVHKALSIDELSNILKSEIDPRYLVDQIEQIE